MQVWASWVRTWNEGQRWRQCTSSTYSTYTSETTLGCMEFPPPGPVHVQCMHCRMHGECLPPGARAVVERTSSNRVDWGELGHGATDGFAGDEEDDEKEGLIFPEIVLREVRFSVSEVPLDRGELYDTYRGTSLIRHTCSRRTLR